MEYDCSFKPSRLIRSAHVQTTIQSVVGRGSLDGRMERLATPDDDFIEILWVGSGAGPLVVSYCRVSAALRGLLMRPAWRTP